MADTVTTIVVANTPKEYVVHLTNISDGTGESVVAKVDKSTLTDVNGAEPAAMDLEQARWSIQGMGYVKLAWDHTTDDTAVVLAASGYEDFRGAGVGPNDQGLRDFTRTDGLKDPLSSGGSGDVLLTTSGQVSGGSYDLTLWFHKRPA